jgi:hypothetical protein
MTNYHFFVSRRAGCAQAILSGRLQTESEAMSWEYLGEQPSTHAGIATICGGLLREGGYMAVRVFRATKGAWGKAVMSKVHPAFDGKVA